MTRDSYKWERALSVSQSGGCLRIAFGPVRRIHALGRASRCGGADTRRLPAHMPRSGTSPYYGPRGPASGRAGARAVAARRPPAAVPRARSPLHAAPCAPSCRLHALGHASLLLRLSGSPNALRTDCPPTAACCPPSYPRVQPRFRFGRWVIFTPPPARNACSLPRGKYDLSGIR